MSTKTYSREKHLKAYTLLLLTAWTIVLISLLALKIISVKETTKEIAITEARAHFNRDNALRKWAASHGGVYVPVDEKTRPNQYLSHVPERDIQTPSGKSLTLMNPAYMMRQINEYFFKIFGIKGHITSLNLLRPQNAPDEWERKVLKAFEQGVPEYLEFTTLDGKPALRLMEPMIATKNCLKCHAHQGYKEGEIRGGISIALPMEPFLARERHNIIEVSAALSVLWLLGVVGIVLGERGLRRRVRERDEAQEELQKYKDELEILVEKRTDELKEANIELKSEIGVRKEAEERTKQSLAEKEILLQEIHHRVKNNMTVITSLLQLQSGRIDEERYRDIFKNSINRIRSMATIHEKLYGSRDLAKVDFNEYIRDMTHNIVMSYGLNPEKVTLKIDAANITFAIDTAIPFGLIVNELISNSLKYAFPEEREGEIVISLRRNDKEEVELTISDNGIGMPEDVDFRKSASLGQTLVNALVKQLHGTIKLNRNKGTSFTITFKE